MLWTAGTFYGKELQKTAKKEFRIEKVIKKNGNKGMVIHLIVGLIKVIYYKMSRYCPKPCKGFEENINVKVDL